MSSFMNNVFSGKPEFSARMLFLFLFQVAEPALCHKPAPRVESARRMLLLLSMPVLKDTAHAQRQNAKGGPRGILLTVRAALSSRSFSLEYIARRAVRIVRIACKGGWPTERAAAGCRKLNEHSPAQDSSCGCSPGRPPAVWRRCARGVCARGHAPTGGGRGRCK